MADAAAVVTVYDEATGARPVERMKLRLVSERIRARELIERRVRAEVDEWNRTRPEVYQGLVQPTASERVLNGYRMRAIQAIDGDEQVERALAAFAGNGFVLLVGDRQVESLDEWLTLREGLSVTFLRLVPLVGG